MRCRWDPLDNGHARAPEHEASRKTSFPYTFGGRYANGPVSTEYLAAAGDTESLELMGVNMTNCTLCSHLLLPSWNDD